MTKRRSSALRAQLLSGKRIDLSEIAQEVDRRLEASWLRDAVLEGVPIDVSNAVFSGPANFHNIRFDHDVRLEECTFEEMADFSYAEFLQTVSFAGTSFLKGASFDSARFRSDVFFRRTVFRKPTSSDELLFNDSDFGGVVDVSEARFLNDVPVSFVRVHFRASAYFFSTQFGSSASFMQADASGALDFTGASFRGAFEGTYLRVEHYLCLNAARFSKTAPVSLREIQIDGSFYCNGARFGSSLDLSASRLRASVQANGSCFFDLVRFSSCLISGDASFSKSKFGRGAQVDFRSATLSKGIDFSDALLKNDADFSDITLASNCEARRSQFRGSTSFERANVAGSLHLHSSYFKELKLEHAQIAGVVDCTNVVITGMLQARESRLGSFVFDGVAKEEVQLYGAQLKGALVLQGARFRGFPVALDIAGVDVGTQAYFDGACFFGKLNAIGLSIESQFSFNKVVCGEEVDFYELNVKRGFFLWESRFRGPFKLESATVGGELYLSGARFRDRASFSGSSIRAAIMSAFPEHGGRATDFHQGVSFARSKVGYLRMVGIVSRSGKMAGSEKAAASGPDAGRFEQMVVTEVANFSDARFDGKVSFYSSSFGGEAIFQRVRFEGTQDVDLRGVLFHKNVYFSQAVFAKGADFTFARFEETAMFRAHFAGDVLFDSCRFRGVADFCDAESSSGDDASATTKALGPDEIIQTTTRFGKVSFVHCEFSADAKFDAVIFGGTLDLRQARFASLFLPTSAFRANQTLPGSVDMRGCTYGQIALAARQFLLTAKGDDRISPYDRRAYRQLEESLRATGNNDLANEVHLLWRRAERREQVRQWHIPGWLLSWVYRLVANYGIRPYRLAVFSIALIVIGTFYFHQPWTMKEKDSKVVRVDSIASWSESFGMSLSQFLPISIPLGEELVPTNRELNIDIGWSERPMIVRTTPEVMATILKLFGWILVPLGIGSLGGVLRRLPGR